METNKPKEGVTKEDIKLVQRVKEEIDREPSQIDVSALVEEVEALKKARIEDQEKLTMLETVADKGRMFNYRNQRATKKPMKINLATYENKVLVGWKTVKDILVKNPTTGLTVGEEQEFELLFLDKDDKITKELIRGYPRFSDIRYSERINAEIVGKTEDAEGKVTFDIVLPDGREIKMAEQFVN